MNTWHDTFILAREISRERTALDKRESITLADPLPSFKGVVYKINALVAQLNQVLDAGTFTQATPACVFNPIEC